MLEPMTNDPVNYVRQGALIASALIMIQQTEITCPKVSKLILYNRAGLGFFSNLSSFEDIFTSNMVNAELIGSKKVRRMGKL